MDKVYAKLANTIAKLVFILRIIVTVATIRQPVLERILSHLSKCPCTQGFWDKGD
jgi:hypothetical protein